MLKTLSANPSPSTSKRRKLTSLSLYVPFAPPEKLKISATPVHTKKPACPERLPETPTLRLVLNSSASGISSICRIVSRLTSLFILPGR